MQKLLNILQKKYVFKKTVFSETQFKHESFHNPCCECFSTNETRQSKLTDRP